MSTCVLLTREGATALITLNRPDKLNALNAEVFATLDAILDDLARDPSVACAILTGAGEKAFAAGADIAAMQTLTADQARAFSAIGQAVCAKIEHVSFPVIGAVQGFALGGGCELALACDFLYASEKAKFGQPEVNLGLLPGFGGTARLPRRIGLSRARELCFTGATIGADEALRLGLVNAVVPAAELLPRVQAVSASIASKGKLAVAQCKRVLLAGADMSLSGATTLESQAFGVLFATHDAGEGIRAFVEKRPPQFTGT